MSISMFVCALHTGWQQQQQPKPAQSQPPPRPNYNVGGFSSPGPHKPTGGASVIGGRDDRGPRKTFGK